MPHSTSSQKGCLSLQPTAHDFQSMVENSDSGILIHDATTKNVLWANPVACEMFGFTVEELIPLKAHHMSSQEHQYRRSVGVAWLQKAVDHGHSAMRWKYRTKSGQDFLTHARASLVEFDQGPVVMVRFRIIEDLDELQDQLARTAGYLDRIMTFAAAGMVLLDERNIVVDISDKAAELFDVDIQAATGRPLTELAQALAPTDPEQSIDDPLIPDDPLEVRVRVPLPDGGERWLQGYLESVRHDGIESRILIVRDISSRIRMEREAAFQEANLHRLSRQNAMGDMAMLIAHELGQPLATATNYLAGILTRMHGGVFEQGDIQFGTRQAQRQLRRASDVVSSVKRYVARNETTDAVHDFNEIVDDALYFARLRARNAGVQLVEELADEPLPLRGEHILLGQVIVNLCTNAIDETARPENTDKRVLVRTYRSADLVGCQVVDFGRGVGGRDLFDMTSGVFSNKSDGAGIGLVLTARIVERHDGDLTVQESVPHGTTMQVQFPLHLTGTSPTGPPLRQGAASSSARVKEPTGSGPAPASG